MTVYNFKKESQLYIVRNGLRYALDIYPDISFSQTFEETAVEVKTLHTQSNMFDNAVITKASTANFNFTIPILRESDMAVVFQLLVNYDSTNVEVLLNTCDIYVVSGSETYKLEYCVFESGVFQIVRDQLITLNISGTGRKLSKYTDALPGILQTRSSSRTFCAPNVLEVTVGGEIQSYVSTISLEVQNKISWVDYTTLHKSLVVSNASDTQYPEVFVVSGRTLSGTVAQYVTDSSNSKVNSWNTNSSIRIRVGNSTPSWVLDVNVPNIVFTNRLDVQDLYMQSYDWRMTYNPTSLSTVINYNTL